MPRRCARTRPSVWRVSVTNDSTNGASGPTRRELRAARLRAYEEEKRRRASPSQQGKGDKKGKGGGQSSSDDRHRQ
jgi:hypothetical protein